MRVGGRSYRNGIEFHATKYKVSFETCSDATKIFLRKKEVKTEKVVDFLSRFPFLRGLGRLVEAKLLFLMMILDVIVNVTAMDSGKSLSGKLMWASLLGVTCVIGCYAITMLKNLKLVWQYHGAEHKVILTYLKDEPLTLENCRKAPRIADNCGTMLALALIFCLIFTNSVIYIFGLINWFSVRFTISWIIAWEIFLLDRNTPILRWLFQLGYWLQQKAFTLEPTDFQLNQAIEAFQLLERAENGEIPEEELQKLLQAGKEVNFFNKLF